MLSKRIFEFASMSITLAPIFFAGGYPTNTGAAIANNVASGAPNHAKAQSDILYTSCASTVRVDILS